MSIFMLALIWNPSFAQNGQPAAKGNMENKVCAKECHKDVPKLLTPSSIAMLKEEFFKENLNLNANQKDAFWKAYNKYTAAQKQAMENEKKAMEKAGIPAHHCSKDANASKPTAEQKVAAYSIQLEKRQAMLTAEQNFLNEISKALTKEQVAQYLQLEKAFKMEMAKLHGQGHGQGFHHQSCDKGNAHGEGHGCGQHAEGEHHCGQHTECDHHCEKK